MKLADLQKKLKPAKLDGYLVTRNNMFLNQDVRNDENLLRLLTGFTGSDGSLLILRDKAILFVDGRYELQAPRETDSREVEVFCTKDCSFHRWLAQNTQDLTRFRLGINPWCLTQTEKEALSVNCISVSAVPDFLPPMLSADAAGYATPCSGKKLTPRFSAWPTTFPGCLTFAPTLCPKPRFSGQWLWLKKTERPGFSEII